jgi:hypothetical protein
MSLYAYLMTLIHVPLYYFLYLFHTLVYQVWNVYSNLSSLIVSITGFFFGAYHFVNFVINPFFPIPWVLSLLAGLMIVFSETIIYWAKKIWEVIGVILDML